MENIVFNRCQTPLADLHLEECPAEVQEQFWDFLYNVPFIRWMVSPERPFVSQLPRDEYGRAIIDVAHPPILENSAYFSQTVREYVEKGYYMNYKPNLNPNSEFGKWLTQERQRGWEGFVDPDTGMWVTGDYYWMLNFCPMHLVETRADGLELRVVAPPHLWDGQFFNSHYVFQGRMNKRHAAMLASRGKGKTTYGAAQLSKRFIIGEAAENREDVQCFVTASDRDKLMKPNQILNVFVSDIDFCAKHTPFASTRLKSSNQEMFWKMGFEKPGSKVEYGTRNTVTGVLTGVNQDKLNGSRGVLYLIEEAGIFKNLNDMVGLIRPSVEQGSSVFGEIYLYGTAGNEESDFTDFAEMYYNPDGYNLYGIENVFDKEGQGRKTIGNFYGAYLNYDDSCIDKDGNSDVTKALKMILMDRYKVKYGSTDVNTIIKRISQYPIVPQEAIIRSQGTIFPITELNERLNQIDNNPDEYSEVLTGELVERDGEVEFVPTADVPIREFPTKDNKVKGCLEIFQLPKKNPDGRIPVGRYGIGCDPYDDDESKTMSLGSIHVMDFFTDTLVAEYTGRPMYADDFYEIVRKLCRFYNAKCLYEQNLKGIFGYFSSRNCTHLLADTPEFLQEKQLITEIGRGNKAKGVRATVPIIKYGFRLIRDWLMKPIIKIEKDDEGNEHEVSIPNLYTLRNRALIKELILWNPFGNFDRIMALLQLMLYRQEKLILYQGDMSRSLQSSSGLETHDFWKKNYPGKK